MQREMSGIRSELDAVRRDIHALRSEITTGFKVTGDLQRATNGRLREAELELERVKAQELERQRLAGLRESRLDRTLATVKWGIGALLTIALAVAGWLVTAAT